MIAYRGARHDSHWYAVVRTALRAHGFAMSAADYEAAAREQWRLGCWLRDRALPERLEGLVALADYQQIAASDEGLWHQLPLMAALGFRQTRAFETAAAPPGSREAAALLGAVFNTGISLVDYIVDECALGTGLFDLLDDEVVRDIFAPGTAPGPALAKAIQRAPDARVRLLLGIVAAFGAQAQDLFRQSGNESAWNGLRRHIRALFEAERAVSFARRSSGSAQALLPALETKSALPSGALLHVARLATPAAGDADDGSRSAAVLGRLFWRLDDLIDLLADHRRRSPNALLLRMSDRLAAHGRTGASDPDLYDVADEAACELAVLLEQLATVRGAARATMFARETIAGWARWHEDAALTKTAASRSRCSAPDALGSAVNMLLGAQQNGYQEAVHHLSFPRWRDGTLAHESHPALLFQRAVVLDALLDARAAGRVVPERATNAEVMSILRQKHRDVRGGWSYIPEVAELPPDADDLGQVLQVLTKHGGPALAFACDEAIRLALDAAEPGGGFPTWIFEPRHRSAADRLARDYLNVVGGAGVHPDVVANLVQGLIEYDAGRYRQAALRGAAYLESAQDSRGAWTSHWYAGPYYGTWKAVAVLAAVAPASPALRRAVAFLRAGQRDDGGWGDASSDPLSTSLSILTATAAGVGVDDGLVQRGASCLRASQQADGGWAASPWIQFQTMDGMESYGSRTITTAFCVKALSARPAATGRVEAHRRIHVAAN